MPANGTTRRGAEDVHQLWASGYLQSTDTPLLHIVNGQVADANAAARRLLGDALFGVGLATLVPKLDDDQPDPPSTGLLAVTLAGEELTVDVEVTPLPGRPGQRVVALRPVPDSDPTDAAAAPAEARPWSVLTRYALHLGTEFGYAATPVVVLIDLDRFQLINANHGRVTGDEVLRVVGHRIEDVLRETERLFWLNGDQFAVVTTAVDGTEVDHLVSRITRAVQRPVMLGASTLHLSACVGVAVAPEAVESFRQADRLIDDADTALRTAKTRGRGQVVRFDDGMRAMAVHQADLETALVGALGRGEFYVEYQPLVDMRTGEATGAEALLRWDHPRFGRVAPAGFLDTAERTGLIDAIGMWVVQDALRVCGEWSEEAVVSVNVSALQLRTPGFAKMIQVALARAGLTPNRLSLELTESVLVETSAVPLQEIEALRTLGVRVGIDDFGTGYASMSYLKNLPIDFMKIDREFVWGLPHSEVDRAIVTSTLTLADALGVPAIAEGVETPEQRDALLELGCTAAQGFLFGRPILAERLTMSGLRPRAGDPEALAASTG